MERNPDSLQEFYEGREPSLSNDIAAIEKDMNDAFDLLHKELYNIMKKISEDDEI